MYYAFIEFTQLNNIFLRNKLVISNDRELVYSLYKSSSKVSCFLRGEDETDIMASIRETEKEYKNPEFVSMFILK